MLKNLENALADKGITKKAYADFLGVCEKTVHNKLGGVTDFRYPEIRRTAELLFPGVDIGYLFDDRAAQEK